MSGLPGFRKKPKIWNLYRTLSFENMESHERCGPKRDMCGSRQSPWATRCLTFGSVTVECMWRLNSPELQRGFLDANLAPCVRRLGEQPRRKDPIPQSCLPSMFIQSRDGIKLPEIMSMPITEPGFGDLNRLRGWGPTPSQE